MRNATSPNEPALAPFKAVNKSLTTTTNIDETETEPKSKSCLALKLKLDKRLTSLFDLQHGPYCRLQSEVLSMPFSKARKHENHVADWDCREDDQETPIRRA
ncbi:hypothetical protein NPIL_644751 [Nephila pilipes]|uniref:Uncharacterized protein n=1 Tax=Nephila pilipes TaxID=299642 RepID=A0A8X6NAS6_NEPPI|nr:hypothetical protein NPIL_644751 [Nephila pilipes]